MYGTSGKLGRGGGRGGGGGGKRKFHSAFHPSPLNRPSSAVGRPSMTGAGAAPRNRVVSSLISAPSTAAAAEETYSLVTSNPLNFGMMIRLAPNLVDEIKRLGAQGGVARIKFDGNINNPVGNIISVGSKEFRFTWSPETGDLCDVYEERQTGEGGAGLLVESGSAWRKLNVQRELDESTKMHVKLRSEEAERKNKSRKAIVLDHRNPSTKSQIKAFAAAECNPRRNFITRKEPPAKKRQVESVSGPPKPVHKSGSTRTAPTKGQVSASPLASPPKNLVGPTSPFGRVNITKGHANSEKSTQDTNKNSNYEKAIVVPLVNRSLQAKPDSKSTEINQPLDIRTVLISVLKESSLKGMSLKALEKAAEEAIPNSGRLIEPILKKIATFQAPDRYFFKSGVEIESLKKLLSERQSSPEDSLHPSVENQKEDGSQDHSKLALPVRTDCGEIDGKMQLRSISQEEPGFLEKVDALNADPFGEKKISGNSERPAISSSDSDSENESSDSGSHSRSRSRSLAGSGSESSSDNESDASTNSKEVSDEEIDIMTRDDDREKHQLQASTSVLLKSPVVSGGMDGQHGLTEINERRDAHNMIDVEKDFHMPEHVSEPAACNDSLPTNQGINRAQEIVPLSQNEPEHQEKDYMWKVDIERDSLNKGRINYELSESSDKVTRGKSKRALNEKKFDAKPDSNKRLTAGNLSQQHISGPRSASEDTHRSSGSQLANTVGTDCGSQNGHSKVFSGQSLSGSLEPLGSSNPVMEKADSTMKKSSKHSENVGHNGKNPGKSLRTAEGFASQKAKPNGETKEDLYLTSSKSSEKSLKVGFWDKHVPSVDSHEKSVWSMQTANALKDDESNMLNGPTRNSRPNVQREISDSELGELRGPSLEETPGYIQTRRKNSSKPTENITLGLDVWNSNNSVKGNPPSKLTTDSVSPAPVNLNILSSSIQEGIQKRLTPHQHAEDIPRPQQKSSQSMRPHQPRVAGVDIVSHSNKGIEMGGSDRLGHADRSVDTATAVHGKPHGRLATNVPAEHGSHIPPNKESRKPKPYTLADVNDKHRDASLTESSDSNRRRRESSSDESSCPYSKYDKEEPQLKGSIRDFSEYAEYVKEYQEKYDIHVSLNKVLESSREEFIKHQRELEAAVRKDPERYYKLVCQIKESFGQSAENISAYKEGSREIINLFINKESFGQSAEGHKRLRKIYVVLYEELVNLKQKMKEFAATCLKNE